MIRNFVTFTRGSGQDVAMFLDAFAEDKESDFYVPVGQQIEQLRGQGLVGTIVERQRDIGLIDMDIAVKSLWLNRAGWLGRIRSG